MTRSLRVKAFSFLFNTACDAKSTKGASVNIQTMCKKKTDSSSVFTRSRKSMKRWTAITYIEQLPNK